MKKIFAVLAAAAVAVSMLAFAGCGDSAAVSVPQNPDSSLAPDTGREDGNGYDGNEAPDGEKNPDVGKAPVEDGVIEGNYREVNALQMASVLSRVNVNKLKEVSGLGLQTGISGSFSMGDTVSANTSLILDYKLGLTEDGIAGAGTATVKAEYSHSDYPDRAVSVDLTGCLYYDLGFVYTSAAGNVAGTVLTGDEKIKINLQEILQTLSEGDAPPSPSWGFDIGSFINVANLIANSSAFGVKAYVDTDDGIKFKLSITEQTVWAAFLTASSGELTDSQLEALKDNVLFNSFKYDIYFAIDGNGAFSRASVVSDIDVSVDLGALKDMIADGGEDLSDFSLNVKGFSTVYAFDDEVILPDTVTGGYYVDITQNVLDFLEKYKKTDMD